MDWIRIERELRNQWRELGKARETAKTLGFLDAERELSAAQDRIAILWDAIAESWEAEETGHVSRETGGDTGGDRKNDDLSMEGDARGDSVCLSLVTSDGEMITDGDTRAKILELREYGVSIRRIARELGVSKGQVEYTLGKRKKTPFKLGGMMEGLKGRIRKDTP